MTTLREAERAMAAWMAARGAPPLPFQRATWRAFCGGDGARRPAPGGPRRLRRGTAGAAGRPSWTPHEGLAANI